MTCCSRNARPRKALVDAHIHRLAWLPLLDGLRGRREWDFVAA